MATSPRPTLADVAAAAGVSRALVSIVIRGAPGASDATRARVLDVVAQLGYRPDQRARLLRRRNSRLLGVAFGIQHAFHADLVAAIYDEAAAVGYDVALSAVTPGRSEQRAVETLLDERVEAVILLGPQSRTAVLAEFATRLPVVAVARRVRVDGVDSVHTAEADGVRRAVEHLVHLGHRAIVHIDGDRAPGASERRRGYLAAMKRQRLEPHVTPGGLGEEDGGRAARRLLDSGRRPTALVAFNDACALGVLDTMVRAGVNVPNEISVVGFDDSRLARLSHVDLTTVAQPIGQLAQAAVGRAVARLAGIEAAGRDTVLTPHLIVRSTTAPPR